MKNCLVALAVFFGLVVSGCASFPQNEVKTVTQMPDVSIYQNKPSAYIEFKLYAGDPQHPESATEMVQAKDKLLPITKRAIESSGLFSSFSVDEFDQDKMDYVIKLRGYNHGNGGAAAVSGFITGFTLGIIPGAATDNYTVIADVFDRQGNKVATYQNKDSVTTWVGIWFIPMAGNNLEKAVTGTLENQIKDALKRLVEEQKLKYSSAEWLLDLAAG